MSAETAISRRSQGARMKRVVRHVYDTLKSSGIYVPVRKAHLTWSMSRWTDFDESIRRLYAQFIKPGDVVFDVGSNVGNRIKVIDRLGATVVAVEPQEICMALLRHLYERKPNVRLVHKALGSAEGVAEMMISNATTNSSMSREWVEAVKASGIYPLYNWDRTQRVEVTTLDRLIEQYGEPSFIKIDVEGYEPEVLAGLSRPVAALSFEFTALRLEAAARCVDHLASLGNATLNYSLGESMVMELPSWVSAGEMLGILTSFEPSGTLGGDIYVKYA